MNEKGKLFLSREVQKDRLINFINKRSDERYVNKIMVSGEWGSGKTFFINDVVCEVLKESKANKKHKNTEKKLYIDTWKMQYIDNVEIAVLISILEDISKNNDDLNLDNEASKKIIGNLGKALMFIASGIIKTRVENEIGETALKSLNNILKDKNDYIAEIKDITDIYTTDYIYVLLDKLGYRHIIFDEIDRTIPEFAIKVIQYIQYFEPIKLTDKYFVYLILNKEALAAIMKHTYGNDYDANAFFEKTYDYKEVLSNKNEEYEYNEDDLYHKLYKKLLDVPNVYDNFNNDNSIFYILNKREAVKLSNKLKELENELVYGECIVYNSDSDSNISFKEVLENEDILPEFYIIFLYIEIYIMIDKKETFLQGLNNNLGRFSEYFKEIKDMIYNGKQISMLNDNLSILNKELEDSNIDHMTYDCVPRDVEQIFCFFKVFYPEYNLYEKEILEELSY